MIGSIWCHFSNNVGQYPSSITSQPSCGSLSSEDAEPTWKILKFWAVKMNKKVWWLWGCEAFARKLVSEQWIIDIPCKCYMENVNNCNFGSSILSRFRVSTCSCAPGGSRWPFCGSAGWILAWQVWHCNICWIVQPKAWGCLFLWFYDAFCVDIAKLAQQYQ